MTGMPASIALRATSVSAAPSVGSSTIASTLSLMKVSIWLICRLASLVPSACLKSMSSYFAASSSAALLMAASHPWSASGPEKPMVTVSPVSSLELPAFSAELLPPSSPESSGSLLVQPTRRAAAASRAPAPATLRRSGLVVRRDMSSPQVGPRRSPGSVGGTGGGKSGAVGRHEPGSGSGRALPCGDPLLEKDGGDDDHALRHGLGRGVEVVEREDVREGREDQDTEDAADDRPPATREQRAADDDGCDRIELPEVAADREGPAPERRPVEEHPAPGRSQREDDDQDRDTEDVTAEHVDELVDGDDLGLLLGDDLGQPTSGGQHRQRGDEGRDPAVRDEDAVDQAAARADRQRGEDHQAPVGVLGHRLGRQRRGPDRGEGGDRADRQVDTPTGDDERHADADDADDRGQPQDRQHVVDAGEAVARGGYADHHQDGEGDDEAEVAARRVAQEADQRRLRTALTSADSGALHAAALVLGRCGSLRRCPLAHCSAISLLPSMTRSSTRCSSMSVARPSWTTRPSLMTSTRSARPSTSSTSLETTTTATPSAASLRTSA